MRSTSRKIFVLGFIFFALQAGSLSAQADTVAIISEEIVPAEDEVLSFALVEKTAVLSGCEAINETSELRSCFSKKMLKYIAKEFKFPAEAQKLGIQGRIYISFVIEKNRSISNIEILRGVDPLLDQEAIRVIKELKILKPAMQGGKPVRMSYTQAINALLK